MRAISQHKLHGVMEMHLQFLRRRVGGLLCIIGFAMVLTYFILLLQAPNHQTMCQSEPVRTLIIDPGHGGEDGGAVASDGTQEADVNLQIALRLRALAEFCGVPVVMTRDSSMIDYPTDAGTIAARKVADQKQRVALINSVEHGTLISIHQNFYPAAGPHGAEALYAPTEHSEEFGKRLHNLLLETLDPSNRRVASPISDEIYLMRNVRCPAVLVECGFLSNPEELERLQSNTYDQKLALVMLSAWLQYFQTGWNL